MAEIVKHGDLSVEQITDIKNRLLLSNKYPTFWEQFVDSGKLRTSDGYSSITFRKLVLPKYATTEIKNLNEGVTPEPGKLVYAEYNCGVENFGHWIGYTDMSLKYNFDDIRNDAKLVLTNHYEETKDRRFAREFLRGKCTITPEATFAETLAKGRIILTKNGAKPYKNGKFACILTVEQSAEILKEYKDEITHTSEKEAPILGYIGTLRGFDLIETASRDMYKPGNTKAYFLLFGRNADGTLPVGKTEIGSSAIQVIDKALGEGSYAQLGENGEILPDALNQRGSVGYKVMGFGTHILYDECLLRGEVAINAVTESVDIDESERSMFTRASASPKDTANVTISAFDIDGKAIEGTATIVVKKNNASGEAVTANDGVYTLAAGTYYRSVAVTGYTTSTGTFVVKVQDVAAGAKAVPVVLAKA